MPNGKSYGDSDFDDADNAAVDNTEEDVFREPLYILSASDVCPFHIRIPRSLSVPGERFSVSVV